MAKEMRLAQVARKLNVGRDTIIEALNKRGIEIDSNPNTKVSSEQVAILSKEFADSAHDKEEASGLTIGKSRNEKIVIDTVENEEPMVEKEEERIQIKKITAKNEPPKEDQTIKASAEKLEGLNVLGKIDLDKKPGAKLKTPAAEKETPAATKPPATKEVKPASKAPEDTKKETKKETSTASKAKPATTDKPAVADENTATKNTPKAPTVKEDNTKTETLATTEEASPTADSDSKAPENKEVIEATTADPEIDITLAEDAESEEVIKAKAGTLQGLKVLGKIQLPKAPKKGKPVASSDAKNKDKKKRPRKRVNHGGGTGRPIGQGGKGGGRGAFNKGKGGKKGKRVQKEEPTEKEIQEKIKATLAKLSGDKSGKKTNRSKYRREKRQTIADNREKEMESVDHKLLKVTEFISANDLASLMEVSVNEVISTCMGLGMFVSINQRLDAESITIIADEFGYDVEFTSTEDEITVEIVEDKPNTLLDRAPIVTIMGHVDHGKTSLLDYIRSANVIDSEAGGITQHIGAYDVVTESGKRIAFLDTPGHEAFTAMRARGAKVTDIVIIVVAADDSVMPQTKEAINHAQVAGVPIIIAINKVDKPQANPEKIKDELSQNNILVEDWGGKYQSQEISAKTGQGVDELLEKVLLEAEVLELKANPNKGAIGTVIEAELDKGRGYVSTVLIQQGTLRVGDVILAGAIYGKVKALQDHRGNNLEEVGPSTPAQILGFNGAPQAGDVLNVMETDKEAREIANKREQLLREQSIRTKKHITLDEIGRRLAIGSFKELNVIIKGDVDGSVEALSDSLLKISTEEVQVNIIHKAVGQISESDVLLASASDAIIIGFQVRPSAQAKKIATDEEIEIRLYSIIYDAIEEVKAAMEGLLDPTVEEHITGNAEVRNVFKISKVGTVAGCYVTDGMIKRNNNIRLVREGIVIYSGNLGQLKRFKEDVGEVKFGYECGISIKGFNDIKEGDVVESYEEREVKRTL